MKNKNKTNILIIIFKVILMFWDDMDFDGWFY